MPSTRKPRKPRPWANLIARAERAQAVLLAAVVAAGGRWTRKTTLWKAFWWAHLECIRERGSELTDHQVVRLPHGPAPADGDQLVDELARAKLLNATIDGKETHSCEIFTVPNMERARKWVSARLSPEELSAIETAANKFKDMTSKAASDFSHKFSAEWRKRANGQPMNIYCDLVPEEQIAAATIRSREVSDALTDVFSRRTGH